MSAIRPRDSGAGLRAGRAALVFGVLAASCATPDAPIEPRSREEIVLPTVRPESVALLQASALRRAIRFTPPLVTMSVVKLLPDAGALAPYVDPSFAEPRFSLEIAARVDREIDAGALTVDDVLAAVVALSEGGPAFHVVDAWNGFGDEAIGDADLPDTERVQQEAAFTAIVQSAAEADRFTRAPVVSAMRIARAAATDARVRAELDAMIATAAPTPTDAAAWARAVHWRLRNVSDADIATALECYRAGPCGRGHLVITRAYFDALEAMTAEVEARLATR